MFSCQIRPTADLRMRRISRARVVMQHLTTPRRVAPDEEYCTGLLQQARRIWQLMRN